MKKVLSVFSLMMLNVIAIDNLRSLTAGAEYGLALVFFYLVAALCFFLPTILITAELATGWPNNGGVYIWVREAFGPRWGFFTIWLQWIYNVVWYPTIFTFIAGIIAYLVDPQLVNNKYFMVSITILSFWGVTLFNFLGLQAASFFSILSAIIGTIFPMLLISGLGFWWVYHGHVSQVHFSVRDFFPSEANLANLAFLTNILFGLIGIEMSAVHAGDVAKPQRDYPRALFYSGIIILATFICASLAIAIVIPVHQLNLVSGLIDAFALFFNAYHMHWFIPLIAILIIVGSLGGASAWILGPARGLLVASQDNLAIRHLTRTNTQQMPVGILLIQGVIATALCTIFLIMPSVNSSYWVLSNLTAQLALIFYILMFAAAIKLRYKYAEVKRAYHIPGGKFGIWLVSGLAIITCIGAIILGFIPPTQVAVGKVYVYEAILLIGIIVCCLPPLLLTYKR